MDQINKTTATSILSMKDDRETEESLIESGEYYPIRSPEKTKATSIGDRSHQLRPRDIRP